MNEAPRVVASAKPGRQRDRALLAVHPDHELGADLLQRDVALLGEREVEAEHRAALGDLELLGDALAQQARGVAPGEGRRAEAAEHLPAHDLLGEVRRAQDGHGGEGGVHERRGAPAGARARRRSTRRPRRGRCG